MVGSGASVWSFVHIADAAEATAAAGARQARDLQRVRRRTGPGGRVAVGNGGQARRAEAVAGARFVGRMFAGEAGVVMMTEIRGASNAKAKRDLGWQPRHPSWREGVVT